MVICGHPRKQLPSEDKASLTWSDKQVRQEVSAQASAPCEGERALLLSPR